MAGFNNPFKREKAKDIESAEKYLSKMTTEVNNLSERKNELNKQILSVSNAVRLTESYLVIEPSDRDLRARLTKGNKMLAELKSELEIVNSKLSTAEQIKLGAAQDLHQSNGVAARNELENQTTKGMALTALQKEINRIQHKNPAQSYNKFKLAKEFGFSPMNSQEEELYQRLSQAEDAFMREQYMVTQENASRRAHDLVTRVLKALNEEMKAEGVELNKLSDSDREKVWTRPAPPKKRWWSIDKARWVYEDELKK